MAFDPIHSILLLLVAAFWVFVLAIAFRCYRAIKGMEKSLAEIATTLRSKS